MEKINVAELLKDCPKGMELYSPLCGACVFDRLNMGTIICKKQNTGEITFTSEGYYMLPVFEDCECMIFPSKDQRDWSKFQRPFKDGDVVTSVFQGVIQGTGIFDYEEQSEAWIHVCINFKNEFSTDGYLGHVYDLRLATEEEKQKLFQAIKDNGYKWNPGTKTLEKLIIPKFHEGDWVVDNCGYVWKIEGILNQFYLLEGVEGGESRPTIDWLDKTFHLWTIQDTKDGDVLCTYKCSEPKIVFILKGTPKKHYALSYHCYYNIMYPHFASDSEKGCLAPNDEDVKPATKEQRETLFAKMKETGYKWNTETKTLEKLVEPKFKVGDKIKHKIENFRDERTIISYGKSGYWTSINDWIKYENQDDWELVSNKFDINTLVPFESRVLTRDDGYSIWQPNVWGLYDKEHRFPYVTTGNRYRYCIPYEGNEHLFNTTNDCDDFYKTWE